MKKILITGSATPDIDAVACAIAYQYFLSQKDGSHTYIAGAQDGMHIEASFVCKHYGLTIYDIQVNEYYDNFILVDASEQYGLPTIVDFAKVAEVIDHRMFADYAAFPHAQFRVEPVGAAATQIAEFFYFDRTVSLPSNIAQLLLCAIYSNTINFKANVTTFRDQRMKQWLETLVDDTKFYEKMFDHKTSYILDNLEEVMFSEDKTVNPYLKLFQLELYDTKQLWSRKDEILQYMEKLSAGVPQSICIAQDIASGETSLLPVNDETRKIIESSGLSGSWQGDIRVIPHIMMRKTIIPYLKK